MDSSLVCNLSVDCSRENSQCTNNELDYQYVDIEEMQETSNENCNDFFKINNIKHNALQYQAEEKFCNERISQPKPKKNIGRSRSFFCSISGNSQKAADFTSQSKQRIKSSKSAVSFREFRKFSKRTESTPPASTRKKYKPPSVLLQSHVPSYRLDSQNFVLLEQIEELNPTSERKIITEQQQDFVKDLPTDKKQSPNVQINKINGSEASNLAISVLESATDLPSKNITVNAKVCSVAFPLCKECGQKHRVSENHEFNYCQELDDDLFCDICLQPFVDPYDTSCGHTFCFICLRNYVRLKKRCPVDRSRLLFVPSDCWQSGVVMRKLVDKLLVKCPNDEYCDKTMQRSNLEAHLKQNCPGTIVHCQFSVFGCSFKDTRSKRQVHSKLCKFSQIKGSPCDLLYPTYSKQTVDICRPDGITCLGLSIIGGNDTPVRNIIVQSILPDSIIHLDGRIRPGDVIINVNGEDFHSIGHVEARAILSKQARLLRFTILREKIFDQDSEFLDENKTVETKMSICVCKQGGQQLGIKLSDSKEGGVAGVHVEDVLPGRVAHASGQLKVGDRILEVCGIDLRNAAANVTANVIQNAGNKIEMVINRKESCCSKIIKNPLVIDRVTDDSNKVFNSEIRLADECNPVLEPEMFPLKSKYSKKIVCLNKELNQGLGIVIAGGMNSDRGNIPIFVEEIHPSGVVGRDQRLRRGDLLISVNSVSLLNCSHDQAVSLIKSSTHDCEKIIIVALELDYNGKEEDYALWEELSGVHHQPVQSHPQRSTEWQNWTPSWKLWLSIPFQLCVTRYAVLKKNVWNEFGFSVANNNQRNISDDKRRIFIKFVAPYSPADIQGYLRSGDEIVAIDGQNVISLAYRDVMTLLKARQSVKLSIMSWPGSVH